MRRLTDSKITKHSYDKVGSVTLSVLAETVYKNIVRFQV